MLIRLHFSILDIGIIMKTLVISFLGPDQRGLVDQLAKLIKANHGNWQTSSMHKISGLFAGVIEVYVPDEHLDGLIAEMKHFSPLTIQVATCEQSVKDDLPVVQLDITANDRTGIVQEITSLINAQGGNLLKLVSKQVTAPHSGLMLFKAKASLTIANKTERDALVSALENLADDLIVDIVKDKK